MAAAPVAAQVAADPPKPKPESDDPFDRVVRGRHVTPMKDEDPFALPASKRMGDDSPYGR